MGEVVGERYRLDAELGAGGTATVWLAHDLVLDRQVAVKLLTPVGGRAAQARRTRMHEEARALARLDHPHVVGIFDVGMDGDRDYLVMEFVEGGSLAERLEAHGPLAPAVAARMALEVLDALAAAHACGIVHRDVKPGNVLWRGDGHIALCDFGIARQHGAGTRTGVMLGSVGYMAPEQRLDARRVGPAADLYGVGCTLFHAVTCETPVDLYLAADHSPRFHAVPRALLPVVRRATRPDPGDRYQTADEMRAALEDVMAHLDGVPAAAAPVESWSGGHPRTAVPGAVPLSVEAGLRERQAQTDEFAWSSKRPRTGRTALWIGLIVMMAVAIIGYVGTRWLDQRVAARSLVVQPQPPSPPPVQLAGVWVGAFDGRLARLELAGEAEDLQGQLWLQLGAGERTTRVAGTYSGQARRLILEDLVDGPGGGTYEAVLDDDGSLSGTFLPAKGADSIPFRLVPLD